MPGRTRIRSQTRAAQNRRFQQKAEPQYKPPEQIKGQKKGATPAQKRQQELKRRKKTRPVKSGDSWFTIAQEEYGDQALTPELMAANPEIKTLRAGQYINLPPAIQKEPPATEYFTGSMTVPTNLPQPQLPSEYGPLPEGELAAPYLRKVAAGAEDVEQVEPLPDWLAWLQPALTGTINFANAAQRNIAEALLPSEEGRQYGAGLQPGLYASGGVLPSVGATQRVSAAGARAEPVPMAEVAADINTAPQHVGTMRIKVLEMLIQNGQMPLYITPEEAGQLFEGFANMTPEQQAAFMGEIGYSLQNGRYVRSSYLPPTPPTNAGNYSGSSYRRGYGGYGGGGGGGGASGGRGRLVGGQQAQSERRYPGYFGVVNWKIS